MSESVPGTLVFCSCWHARKWGRRVTLKCLLNIAKSQFYTVWSRKHHGCAASYPWGRIHLHNRTLPRQQSPNTRRGRQRGGWILRCLRNMFPKTLHTHTRCVREAGTNRQSAEPLLEGWGVFTEVVRTSAMLHILGFYTLFDALINMFNVQNMAWCDSRAFDFSILNFQLLYPFKKGKSTGRKRNYQTNSVSGLSALFDTHVATPKPIQVFNNAS